MIRPMNKHNRKLKTGWMKSHEAGLRPMALTPEAKERRREWLANYYVKRVQLEALELERR